MMRSRAARPRGSEAVREALIAAAAKLFAQYGPAAVSVREIAAAAQVNHGLVHRHFGSKDALLQAVFDRLARDLAGELRLRPNPLNRPGRQMFRATRTQGTLWRILAYSLLEQRRPRQLQREYPVMTALVRAVRMAQVTGRFDPKFDARALVAVATGATLGWLMFEPFLLASTGLDRVAPRQRYREISRMWRRVEKAFGPRT
ncbi:MAG: TetR/AcrR family transcriptional regulator [SAR324 cluster bacterium]